MDKAGLELLHQNAIRLLARHEQLEREQQTLTTDVRLAMSKIAYKPEMDQIMDAFQMRVHQKTVGKIERVLTGILHDIFPDAGPISLQIETKKQVPHLTVSVMNGRFPEDVYTGRGGSINNVTSAGLRFLALSRGGYRKFIVLDEPDCWLKPDRIPAFVSVIDLLSRQMGIQVLMVSHHDSSFFEHCASLVHLKSKRTEIKEGQKIHSLCVHEVLGKPIVWNDDQQGVRGIHLRNFWSYEDVTIPLSPGLTVLIGENDIGKSGSVMALRALVREEWLEAYIRHGEDAAYVELDLGPEGSVLSGRTRTGSKKYHHAYIRHDFEAVEGTPKWLTNLGFSATHALHHDECSTPAWVSKLGFDTDELDVQISLQKKPVFLLDKPASQQAAVLSIGLEAGVLSILQSLYKSDFKKLADTRKNGEKRLEQIKKELAILDPIVTIEKNISANRLVFEAATNEAVTLTLGQQLIEKIDKLTRQVSVQESPVFKNHWAAPVLLPVADMIKTCRVIHRLKAIEKLRPVVISQASTTLGSTHDLSKMISTLERAELIKQSTPVLISGSVHALMDTRDPIKLGATIKKLSKFAARSPIMFKDTQQGLVETGSHSVAIIEQKIEAVANCKKSVSDLKDAERAIDIEINQLSEILGGQCPSCGQVMGDHHGH